MKKLFLLLLFSFSFSFAQAPFVQPSIDPGIDQAFNDLVEISQEHQKDFTALLQDAGLVSILVVDSLPDGDLGLYESTGSTFTVKIARKSLADPLVLKWTLAHELGHGLKMKHTDAILPDGSYPWSIEIMSGNGVLDKRHILYQLRIHSYYGKDIWKNYFDQL